MEYYIEGNPDKADQIEQFFKSHGYTTCNISCASKDMLYFTVKGCVRIHWCDVDSTMADVLRASEACYKHIELPKFKVGDVLYDIRFSPKLSPVTVCDIDFEKECYIIRDAGVKVPITFACVHKFYDYCDEKEVILPFKIGDLVLTRATDKATWKVNVFSHLCDSSPYFACANCTWPQCIPLKGNEHLAGTAQQCNKCYPSICYGKKNNA